MQSDDRYSRQVRFAPIGAEGQARISSARVAVIGAGALGSVSAELLVRAGVGFIRIIDRRSTTKRMFSKTFPKPRLRLPNFGASIPELRSMRSLTT